VSGLADSRPSDTTAEEVGTGEADMPGHGSAGVPDEAVESLLGRDLGTVWEWDDAHRRELADVLAATWVGNLTRQEGPADTLVDAVVERFGFGGLTSLLSTGGTDAQRLSGLLSACMLLEREAKEFSRYVREDAERIALIAAEAWDKILRGDLETAAAEITTTLHDLEGAVEAYSDRKVDFSGGQKKVAGTRARISAALASITSVDG
jgi:hypothetical protein